MNKRLENIFELVRSKLDEITQERIDRAIAADKARGGRDKMSRPAKRYNPQTKKMEDMPQHRGPTVGHGQQDKPDKVAAWVDDRGAELSKKNDAILKRKAEAAAKRQRAKDGKQTGADLDSAPLAQR
jgi:23S rRNA G2069 N7-methylase RlmK/C1962 C5-methylase RlmI